MRAATNFTIPTSKRWLVACRASTLAARRLEWPIGLALTIDGLLESAWSRREWRDGRSPHLAARRAGIFVIMLSRLRLITRTPHWRRVGASAVALGAAAGVVNSGLAFPPALCEASHEQGSTPKAATSQPSLMAKCVAEAVGTGLIIQGGCGVVCAAKYAGSGVGTFGLAAVWGVSVMLAVYATAPISGAHAPACSRSHTPATAVAHACHLSCARHQARTSIRRSPVRSSRATRHPPRRRPSTSARSSPVRRSRRPSTTSSSRRASRPSKPRSRSTALPLGEGPSPPPDASPPVHHPSARCFPSAAATPPLDASPPQNATPP